MTTKAVYAAINAVQKALALDGVAKTNNNAQQGYKFRGIDDMYNALATTLATHSLTVIPRCTERTVTERVTSAGKAIFYVVVKVEFDFVCGVDGSMHTACTFGEAMDSADKATNKAMSAAFKYVVMQTFCIPTEGDNDADATSHEVAGKLSNESAPSNPAVRIKSAVAAGNSSAAATYLAGLGDSARDSLWAQLTKQEQDTLTAAWPKATS